MKFFKLPDLGEGLPDAIIREWYVKEGEEVAVDQSLVAMETAKALVDVPSPFAGKIEKLFGKPGDIIKTGHSLIGFEGEAEEVTSQDAGTVVGAIETGETVLKEAATGITVQKSEERNVVKTTPAVRMLAKQLGVDLSTIKPQGEMITTDEVKQAAQLQKTSSKSTPIEGGLTPLSNVRRAMVLSMNQSHRDVVPVSLVDDADIQAWEGQQDITIRLIRAIQEGCKEVPIMNAYFDGEEMGYQIKENINIGIAVDTPHGLYIPVLKDVIHRKDNELRQQVDRFKEMAQTRSFLSEDLRSATIMLSNFGTFAGRYANPILLPPMVTVIGVGRIRKQVMPENGQLAIHRVLPLSVTSDHRLITGGEIARFLKVLIDSLEKA
ncbi:dihydrolipoamide acetyltransferase family protein [Candidatus Coxiella mudrowiae]|uniref:Dihydrolipoamide acetyltransferase component of pyruvate dehydrogenase complex n=1 Tax=Candidatus Coxiella mudrowiae TaxID=2054173 RepID=A0ABM5UTX5_9COXI|nr:dihydrolipoamide acetyltransferase family protein [Candidatus Coxiella mudrowiae]AKQ33384.1 Dihydrolipoyllysine-residue acetyltransferase E2 component of pyruvate dehydrogenase complex [Candidatus Coxiella mudrowiae]AKQ33471.1 Dihydrolipoyllysine-residue acetyltransferase E2 component of pyruvate dehydrogenase complex [Candidatus Coxiella mudrowiae]